MCRGGCRKGDDVMWKLKLDENGKVVMKDNLPVYVKEDGSEIAFDAEKSFETVGRVMGEAKTNREAKEAAEAKLTAFADMDPAEAKKALQTVKDLTGKDIIDAGKLETVRQEAIKATEEKFKPFVDENGKLKGQLESVTLGNAFANSEFIKSKIADNVPRDMLQATFGKYFQMTGDGKVVAKLNGNDVYSPSNPGQPASFDEALEIVVGQYPGKANILKGTGASGTGSPGSRGGSGMSGGKPAITRAAFEALGPAERMSTVASHVITD